LGFGHRKHNSFASPIEQLKKKYLRFKIITLAVIVLLFGGLFAAIYTNFDLILFRNLIARHYVYTDVMEELFERHLGFVPAADEYARYFDNLMISIVTQEIRQHSGDRFTYLYTPTQHVAQQERVRVQAANAGFYEEAPGIVRLFLPNISEYVRDFVFDNRYEINSFDNLILDLRGNNGGMLDDFQAIAGLFLESGTTVGREVARWGPFSTHRRARGGVFFEFDNIVILQNSRTASAAEGLILALTENLDNVTTIGTQTVGKGIGQVTLPLRRGFAVRATVIVVEAPSGFEVHDIGIAPDIYFENAGEGIVEFAVGLILND